MGLTPTVVPSVQDDLNSITNLLEIHEQERLIEDFSEKLWLTTIENVTVYHDGRMVFRFKNGMEVTK